MKNSILSNFAKTEQFHYKDDSQSEENPKAVRITYDENICRGNFLNKMNEKNKRL
jgi:hypothetical protein